MNLKCKMPGNENNGWVKEPHPYNHQMQEAARLERDIITTKQSIIDMRIEARKMLKAGMKVKVITGDSMHCGEVGVIKHITDKHILVGHERCSDSYGFDEVEVVE